MSEKTRVKRESKITDIIALDSYDEHNDILKQIAKIFNIQRFDVTLTNCVINSKYTLPQETKYLSHHTKCKDFNEIYLWIYITPENRIIIEMKAGCWRRYFDINHPKTIALLLRKIESYDLWTLNEILSKSPVTIKSFN